MANEYQEALIGSIDYLISNRVSQLALDKTVVATVKKCVDATKNQYTVSYSGGSMYAYAQEDASYAEGQSVYVLVPQGDFTQKKIIVGKASNVGTDGNINFVSSTLSDYNLVGTNVMTETAQFPIALNSYYKEDYHLLYQRNLDDTNFTNSLSIDDESLTTYIQEAERVMVRAKFQTRLPKEHRSTASGVYGVQIVAAFKAQDTEDSDVKLVSYVLDCSTMDGNPYLYTSPTSQYAVFPIDKENFLYINSVMVYSKDFVQVDDTDTAYTWGDDIFVSSIEFYGLKQLDAVNGDYRLQLSSPYGMIYKGGASPTETLQVIAQLSYRGGTDLSGSATYYWFKEDPRVSTLSENYQMYGGAGWSYEKNLGSDYIMTTMKVDNRAYENKYLCVCVYKQQVILKTKFSIYNNEAKLDIGIKSDIGTKFSFDRGVPNLTCTVNGKEDEPFDEVNNAKQYRFLWSKIDELGQRTTFDKSVEELQEEYSTLLNSNPSYSALAALKNQIAEMKDVVVDKNRLSYPVKDISSSATFQCSLYIKDTAESDEYYAGFAQIILYNEGTVQPSDYYILIENSNQVFQYSESGVAPNNERYADPQEVLPLYCHLYDPAGLEVDDGTYTVKWRVPTDITMLKLPTELSINPANGKFEWLEQKIFPTDIADEFDYQAVENQVVAIVNYNGQEFQQSTNLSFIKVGDNGTNGTDVICKIVPSGWVPTYDDEMFALRENKSGLLTSTEQLSFEVYKSGMLSSEDYNVSWGILGGTSRTFPLSVDSNGKLTYKTEKPSKVLSNRTVKGKITDDGQEYYAFLPICSVQSLDVNYTFIIKQTKTLKQVVYNSDGRHPLYNKNQGISYALYKGAEEVSTDEFTCTWTTTGGLNDSGTSQLKIQSGNELVDKIDNFAGNFISLIPLDTYTGEYCNNCVIGDVKVGSKTIAKVYYTLYIGLNRYSLSSLNGWDGNHIEINEDSNYILAPQVGAGVKNADNSFTGLVMGTAKSYDEEETVGLLGYSEGKQSIFLDAKTGKAVFGLPENQTSEGKNKYTQGRIELVPNGTSTISNWAIGSRSIYSMNTYEGTISPFSTSMVGSDIKVRYDEDKDNPIVVEPDKPYTDFAVVGSQISVPPTAQGMILNATPAYLSIKGMPLTEDNCDIVWNGSNTTLRSGDSLEVEIDPKKSSLFSIYRHTNWDDNEDGNYSQTHLEKQPDGTDKEVPNDYRRYPLVGINAYGQFYTNAVEDGNSSMSVGAVGAFTNGANESKWAGAQFGYNKSNLLKFFVDAKDTSSDVYKTLHLSSGSDVSEENGSEYVKPYHFHATELAIYTADTKDDEFRQALTTNDRFLINTSEAFMGHKETYISLPTKKVAELITPIGFNFSSGNATTNVNGVLTETVSGAITQAYNSTLSTTVKSNVSTTISSGSYKLSLEDNRDGISLQSKYSGITSNVLLNSQSAQIGITNASLTLNTNKVSTLTVDNGLTISAKAKPIAIKNVGSADGIEINAKWSDSSDTGQARVKMLPASDGYSTIYATTGNGNFTLGKKFSSSDKIGGNTVSGSGLEVNPGVFTKYLVLTGVPNGENGGFSLIAKGNASVDFLHVADKDQNGYSISTVGGITAADSITSGGVITADKELVTNVGIIVEGYGMTSAWFKDVRTCSSNGQTVYSSWRGGSFPRTDAEIQSIASQVASSVAGDAVITAHGSTQKISAHIEALWTTVIALSKKVNSL